MRGTAHERVPKAENMSGVDGLLRQKKLGPDRGRIQEKKKKGRATAASSELLSSKMISDVKQKRVVRKNTVSCGGKTTVGRVSG